MKNLIFFIITLLVLLLVAWRLVPIEAIVLRAADNVLKKYDCSLGLKGLEKGLFLGFSVKRIFVKSGGKELISCEYFKTFFDPFTFSFVFNASVLDGTMEGKYKILDGLFVRLKGLSLEELNLDLGTRAKGVINANMEKNRIDFWSDKISFPDVFFEQSILPLSMFSKIKGTAFVKSDHLLIESAKFEGQIGAAVLKGSINRNFFDVIVDFMPAQDELWSSILAGYRIKENLYRIPLKKNLSIIK
jgi:hypothetical protein